MKRARLIDLLMAGFIGLFAHSAGSAPLAISDIPLFLSNRVDPNVLFDMSIESPMGGAAYSGPNGATNYVATTTFFGYFDPNKCYTYSASNRFEPVGATGTNHTCSGQWSGNLLNWAAVTAIDEFRWVLTGGDRYVDTSTETVIERASAHNNSSWYPIKRLNSGVNVAPSTVTPYADADIYLTNHNAGKGMKVGTTSGGTEKGTLNVRVKVCDSSVGLETNCTGYGTSNKPTGLIQNYSNKMRFALASYLADNSQSRDGGVLRSKMKYTGPSKYVIGTGTVANANKEWSEVDGTFIVNPDPTEATASGVTNSGVVNYINKFGSSGYKSSDPAGELYYEALRYYKNLGPTPEYSSGLTAAMKDAFPVITTWDDPIQAYCQKNFIVGINDANPWLDKKLPGTFFTCAKAGTSGMPSSFTATDCGEPSNPDTSINVKTLTDTVGLMEGLNGALWSSTGTWTSGAQSGTNDSVGWFPGDTSGGSCVNKTITTLGEVLGTCAYPPKQNSYYIAGLAYYANSQDIRTDHSGKQSVVTYMIDTQEYDTNPLDGRKNMLWLTGKYGGFIDSNGDGNPNVSLSGSTTSEWDADGDGAPDNYVLATEPQKLISGLSDAFNDIVKRTGSASSVATSSTELRSGSKFYQAQFTSGEWSGTLISNLISTGALQWDAGTKVNTQVSSSTDSRVIITNGLVSGAPDGVPFQWSTTALTASQQTALNASDSRGSDRVGYLRGRSQHEGSAAGTFRQRPVRKLGDIINSNPWFVGEPNAGYSDVEYPGYTAFRAAYINRYPIVYVGANDGMLHGFNACEVGTTYTGSGVCTATVAGKEAIAYVPSSVYPNLSQLTSQTYDNNHKFFVDGSPMVGDAYVNSSWRSVLVGSLNSGGKAFFALDVTNPANNTLSSTTTFSETNAASLLLWEFTDSNDADLGLTYNLPPISLETGQPRQIVRMANGKWAAIVGNGYNSSSGNAALFILFLDGPTGTGGAWTAGSDYIKLVADTSGSNGLSTPIPFDSNGDGYVDTVYAGDLKGHLWKFFVGPNATDAAVTTSPATWIVALAGSPLFTALDTASNAQPIMSPPVVSLHPTSGWMVLFGTGKYLETSDLTNTLVQTFYGIQDTGVAVAGRNELVQQVLNTTSPRLVTATNPVAVTIPPTPEKGWYADLSISGERLVGRPTLENGLIFIDTISPSNAACTGGVNSGLLSLNYLTGAMPTFDVFGLGNLAPSGSPILYAAGISTGSALGGTTFIRIPSTGASTTSYRGLSSQLTGSVNQFDINVGTGSHGRINWREIVQ
jgi:type IV pilus assembly protein PilY1